MPDLEPRTFASMVIFFDPLLIGGLSRVLGDVWAVLFLILWAILLEVLGIFQEVGPQESPDLVNAVLFLRGQDPAVEVSVGFLVERNDCRQSPRPGHEKHDCGEDGEDGHDQHHPELRLVGLQLVDEGGQEVTDRNGLAHRVLVLVVCQKGTDLVINRLNSITVKPWFKRVEGPDGLVFLFYKTIDLRETPT